MDAGILKRIRENEHEYHATVMKYLHEKESELRGVLKRLEEKNTNTDGKDILISKLNMLVNKFESDGRDLLRRVRKNEDEHRQMKHNMRIHIDLCVLRLDIWTGPGGKEGRKRILMR